MARKRLSQKNPPAFYRVRELMELLACSRWTIIKAIRDGSLRAARLGHSYRVTPEDLSAWLFREQHR